MAGRDPVPLSSASARDRPSSGAGPHLLVGASAVVGVLTIAFLIGGGSSYPAQGIVIGVLSVLVSTAIIRSVCGRVGMVSPSTIVIACHALLFVLRPVYSFTYQDSANLFTGGPYDASFVQAETIAGVGLVSFAVVYALRLGSAQNSADSRKLPSIAPLRWRLVSRRIWILCLVSGALFSVYIATVGVGSYVRILSSGRSAELGAALDGSSGYFYSGLQFATGAAVLVLAQGLAGRERRMVVAGSVLLLLISIPSLSAGSRSAFLPLALALTITATVIRGTDLRAKHAAIWGVPVLALGVVAPRLWRVDLTAGGSFTQAAADSLRPENLIGSVLGGLDTAMVDAFALQVSWQQDPQFSPRDGSTYLSLLGAFIPRSVWPSKPGTVDQYLNAELFPTTSSRGIGFSFGVYSEPYVNFGIIGVVAVLAVGGFVLGSLARWLRRDALPVHQLVIYALVVSYIFPIMRGSVSFGLQRFLVPVGPLLLCLYLGAPLAATVLSRRKESSARTRTGRQHVAGPVAPGGGGRASATWVPRG